MLEKSLVFVKPPHTRLAGVIFKDLDQHGVRIITKFIESTPRKNIEEHYIIHKGKPFYEYMCDFFVGKPLVLAVYQGEDIIKTLIDAVGDKDPFKASGTTIRGKYGTDSLEVAISNKRPVENVIHRSDSIQEAEREINVWRNFLYPNVNSS